MLIMQQAMNHISYGNCCKSQIRTRSTLEILALPFILAYITTLYGSFVSHSGTQYFSSYITRESQCSMTKKKYTMCNRKYGDDSELGWRNICEREKLKMSYTFSELVNGTVFDIRLPSVKQCILGLGFISYYVSFQTSGTDKETSAAFGGSTSLILKKYQANDIY